MILKKKETKTGAEKPKEPPVPNKRPIIQEEEKKKDTVKPESTTSRREFKKFALEQIRATTTTRWIRFSLVSLIWILFCIWLNNLWLLLVLILFFDIYITGFIPFTFWKKHPNKMVRRVGGWIDSIIYALILVYFVFAFVGQNYKIPSSSLEKTLLVGDYLWVNKMTYGPRVPQTPLHFPLAQHTILGGKSYIDAWQLDYHRLPGLRDVERYDIVVFNAPHCDTVALKMQELDYYHIVYALEHDSVNPVPDGRKYIAEHPERFGKVVWRPVDRRENYVKRAIGLPGERLQIIDDIVYINGKALKEPANVQHNYVVQVNAPFTESDWDELGVSIDDRSEPLRRQGIAWPFYIVPMTNAMVDKVAKMPQVMDTPQRFASLFGDISSGIFPLEGKLNWSLQNMGEIWIPRQGSTLRLTTANLPIYRRVIETYEGNKVEVKGEDIFINGRKTDYYTFKLDYYWMMGDNRDNSMDSRYWGFVPEDHVVGTPMTVLISFDKDKSLFNSVRWNRIFKTPNPDK